MDIETANTVMVSGATATVVGFAVSVIADKEDMYRLAVVSFFVALAGAVSVLGGGGARLAASDVDEQAYELRVQERRIAEKQKEVDALRAMDFLNKKAQQNKKEAELDKELKSVPPVTAVYMSGDNNSCASFMLRERVNLARA